MTFSTNIAIRETLPTMIATYQQATKDIENAYQALEDAQKRLRTVFLDSPGDNFCCNDRHTSDVGKKASDEINKVARHRV